MTDVDALARAVLDAFPTTSSRDQRLALILLRELAEGAPVSRARLAIAANVTERDVDQTLARWTAVFYDEHQHVIAFIGLAIRETPHRLILGERELWGWCAWDTLFLPELLGEPALVSSTCPLTRQPVTLTVATDGVHDLDPPGAVVSFLTPDKPFDATIMRTFCRFVHFFASPDAGAQWTTENPGTFVISVDDAHQLGRKTNHGQFAHALATARQHVRP